MIKFAFYKAQKGDFWGNLISGYTGIFNWKTPPYSHVEIGLFIDGKWIWYSSSSKRVNGQDGTRWILNEDLLKHPERWDVYEVEELRPIEDMRKTCIEEHGKPYDWAGIMGFATLFGQLNLKKKWYCSEICHYVFFGKWKKRISPKRLFKKLRIDNGGT
jgi:hypothetical protein